MEQLPVQNPETDRQKHEIRELKRRK